MSNFLTQYSAGGAVYQKQNDQILVCMIRDSYGNWTFPKGHQEPNESLEQTAQREISEETGIPLGKLIYKTKLGTIDYWFSSSFARDRKDLPNNQSDEPIKIHKFVTYYLFEVPPTTQLKAQVGEVEAIDWVPLTEIEERNAYTDNQPIIGAALTFLRENM